MTGAKGTAAAVWLALLGSVSVAVGGYDTVVGRELAVRMWGVAVLGAGVLLLAGAIGLRRRHAQGRALAMVAAFLGVAFGVLTFLTQAVNDDPDNRLLLWGAIIVLSAGAAVAIRTCMPEEEREQGLWSRLPVLKSAVTAGLLLSLAQFWHSSIYLPTTEPVSITLSPSFEKPETRGDRVLVRGSVKVENTSGARVVVLGSAMVLSGNQVSGKPDDDGMAGETARRADRGEVEAARLYPLRLTLPDIMSRGRFVPDDSFFHPGETVTRPFLAYLPRGYDLARVDIMVAIARPTAGEVEGDAVRTHRAAEATVITRKLEEDGLLRGLTRSDRYVVTTYPDEPWTDSGEFVPIELGFDRRRSTTPPQDFTDRMGRFYGVNVADAAAVVPLDR